MILSISSLQSSGHFPLIALSYWNPLAEINKFSLISSPLLHNQESKFYRILTNGMY